MFIRFDLLFRLPMADCQEDYSFVLVQGQESLWLYVSATIFFCSSTFTKLQENAYNNCDLGEVALFLVNSSLHSVSKHKPKNTLLQRTRAPEKS